MIVPAILTDSKDGLVEMVNLCEGFTNYVQVDIMDGVFVPSRSVAPSDVESVHPPTKSEAHLMVEDPLMWLDAFKQFGSHRIIFHYEISQNHRDVIDAIRGKGFQVGIAVNPPTPMSDFEHLLADIDSVLFMSVNPGFYGSPFIPEVVDKIKQFKK